MPQKPAGGQLKTVGVYLVIISMVFFLLSLFLVDSDFSGITLTKKEIARSGYYPGRQTEPMSEIPYTYVWIPLLIIFAAGLSFIFFRQKMHDFLSSIPEQMPPFATGGLFLLLGIIPLILFNEVLPPGLSLAFIVSGALLLLVEKMRPTFMGWMYHPRSWLFESNEVDNRPRKPNCLQKIWRGKFLGAFLTILIVLITIFCILVLAAGLFVATNLAVSDFLRIVAVLMVIVFTVVIYAIFRFFPDLTRIFIDIERNTTSGLSDEKHLRFTFIKFSYAALRIMALLIPLVFFRFFFLIKSGIDIFRIEFGGVLNLGPDFMGYFLYAIPALSLIYARLFKCNLAGIMRRHSSSILFTAILIGIHSVELAGFVLLVYFLKNAIYAARLKKNAKTIVMILLIVVLITNLQLIVNFIDETSSATFNTLGMGNADLEVISSLFRHETPVDEWNRTYFRRPEPDNNINSVIAGIAPITSQLHVAIPIVILLAMFAMAFLWLSSDVILLIGQIERNFRPSDKAPPWPKSFSYAFFTILKLLFICLFTGLGILLVTKIIPYDFRFSGDINLWHKIANFYFARLRGISIYTMIRYILVVGLLGNIVRLLHDICLYTKSNENRKRLKFFALDAYTRLSYIAGGVLSAIIIFVTVKTYDVAKFVQVSDRWGNRRFINKALEGFPGAQASVEHIRSDFLVLLIGIAAAVFAFFLATFVSSLGRRLLEIERNIRQPESDIRDHDYFGVRFFVVVMKTFAIVGALLIYILPNLFASSLGGFPPALNIMFFAIAGVFYIATAALPDLCMVLIKIERNTRAGYKIYYEPDRSRQTADRLGLDEVDKTVLRRQKMEWLQERIAEAKIADKIIRERFFLGRLHRLQGEADKNRIRELNTLIWKRTAKLRCVALVLAFLFAALMVIGMIVSSIARNSKYKPFSAANYSYQGNFSFDHNEILNSSTKLQRLDDSQVDNKQEMKKVIEMLDSRDIDIDSLDEVLEIYGENNTKYVKVEDLEGGTIMKMMNRDQSGKVVNHTEYPFYYLLTVYPDSGYNDIEVTQIAFVPDLGILAKSIRTENNFLLMLRKDIQTLPVEEERNHIKKMSQKN